MKKFRVWHKDFGKFLTDDNEWVLDFNGKLHFIYTYPSYHKTPVPEDWYVVQQFTGLKDKNGKEIWEGDILTDRYEDAYKMEVTFSDGAVQFDGCDPIDFFDDGVSVIGNIFENPELIK